MEFDLTRYNELKGMPVETIRALALVEDPTAVAYMWLKAYELQVNAVEVYDDDNPSYVSLEEMIDCAQSHQGDNWGHYISQGGRFEGFSTDPMFYDKLRILVGNPNIEEGSFFSCSC